MCPLETVLLATSVAISAATAISTPLMSAASQGKAAQQQAAYQQQMAQARYQQQLEAKQLADQSYAQQTSQINLRQQEEAEAAGQQIQQNQLAAMEARGRARASAGEAGVAGLSIDNLYNDFYRQQALSDDAALQNLNFKTRQLDLEKEGIRTQLTGQLQGIRPYIAQPVNRPSWTAATISAVGQGASAYGSYASQKAQMKFYKDANAKG